MKSSAELSCDCRSHNGFLTAKGLEEAAQRSLEGLEVAGMDARRYVDRVGSVSASQRDETRFWLSDEETDSQYQRFLNEVGV